MSQIFTISETEIRNTRRGTILPVLLILSMAAMFGFDSSRSQPMHFLMVFSVGIMFAAAVFSVSWYGARRRIAEYRQTTLTLTDDELIWSSGSSRTALAFNTVTSLAQRKRGNNVHSISLVLADGSQKTLQAYDRMNELYELLTRQVPAEQVRQTQ